MRLQSRIANPFWRVKNMHFAPLPRKFCTLFGQNSAPSLVFLFLSLLLAGCSSLGLETDKNYEDKNQTKIYKNGSVASDSGGFSLLGGDDRKKDASALGIGVNGFLWRAALDTIAFLPIAAADPFGGVITTDWYAAPNAPNERIKLNVFILDRDLRADGVRVSVFRQTRGVDGTWVDSAVNQSTGSSLENTILTRARQMRLAQKEAKQ